MEGLDSVGRVVLGVRLEHTSDLKVDVTSKI